jgi:predicted Zn-dependent protease
VPGLFYNLGKFAGQTARKGKWVFDSVTGTEEDAIKAEEAVGRDLAAGVVQEIGLDEDAEARAFIEQIAAPLVRCVKCKARRFAFHVVPSPEPNAFALPGGFIFVNRPLLDLCGWERDEAAFVIGHEMAHVIRRHAIDRIVHNSAINAASRVVRVAGPVGGMLKNVGLRMVTSAYSQENEFVADALGAKLASAAGFDGGAAMRMLGRLCERQAAGDADWMSEYFSTHPPFEKRIESLRKMVG